MRQRGGRNKRNRFYPTSLLLPSPQRGFTLLEVLVALVIFGIITVALSNAMSAALRARALAEQRQADSAVVRAVFAILGRDLQSAYASVYDPNALFTAGGGSGGSSSSGGALLTFATLSHPIATTDPNVDPTVDASQSGGAGAMRGAQNGSNDPPQQAAALVRYDLDPQSGLLTRYSQAVPNVQTVQSATPSPQDAIAQNVISLQLQFWDPTQQNWRDSWDFEQPNLPPSETSASTLSLEIANDMPTGDAAPTATVPTTGTPPGNNVNGGSSGSGNSDIGLPSAVQVTLVIRKRDGSQGTYSTILPIVSPKLQDYPYVGGVTTNPNPQSATTTSGSGQ